MHDYYCMRKIYLIKSCVKNINETRVNYLTLMSKSIKLPMEWQELFHIEIDSFMFLTHDMNIVYEIHHMKINNRLDNNKYKHWIKPISI